MTIFWNIYILIFSIAELTSLVGLIALYFQLVYPGFNFFMDAFACFNGFFLLLAMVQYRFKRPSFHHHFWRFFGLFLVVYAILFLHRGQVGDAISALLKTRDLLTFALTLFGVWFYLFLSMLVLGILSPALYSYLRCAKLVREKQLASTPEAIRPVETLIPAQPAKSRIRKEQIPGLIIVGIAVVAFLALMIGFTILSIPKEDFENREREINRILIAGQPDKALPLALKNLELSETKLKVYKDKKSQQFGQAERTLAVIYSQLKDYPNAERHMKSAFDAQVDSLDYLHTSHAEIAFVYAITLLNNHKIKEAIPYLDYVRASVKEYKDHVPISMPEFFTTYMQAQMMLNPDYDVTGLKKDIDAIVGFCERPEYKMPLPAIGELRRLQSSFDSIHAEILKSVKVK